MRSGRDMTKGQRQRQWRWGIRAHVTLVASLIVAVTLLASGVAASFLLHQSLVSGLDTAQLSRAESVAAQASEGMVKRTIAATPQQSSLVQILDSTGVVVAATGNVEGEGPILSPPPRERRPTALTISSSPIGDGEFRIQAVPIMLSSGPGWVYVAGSLSQVDAATASLVVLFGIGLPLILLVVGFIVWRAVSQALRPVDQIRQRASEIGARNRSQRVPVPTSHDEIARLAVTMNDMLARLEAAAVRQDQFIGDASHELKSPLAAIRAQLDVAIAHPDPAQSAHVFSALDDQVARMTVLTEDLLILARSTEALPKSQTAPVDLDELMLTEVRRLKEAGQLSVVLVAVQAARVRGSQRDLTRALRNLVENAVEHAHSEILLSLTTRDGWADIMVADDGDGVPPSDRVRLFERFHRLDTARTHAAAGGHFGLGLAIASQITRSHGGTLTVNDRPDGQSGASFVVRLPVERD